MLISDDMLREIFFQDILENEDIKLDNMFMASLIGDIVRVSFYFKFCF